MAASAVTLMRRWIGCNESLRVRESGYGLWRKLVNLGLTLITLACFAAPAAATTRILALGDSLTAGYGLPIEDGFPARLQAWLRDHGIDAEVTNAGVSGDTSAGPGIIANVPASQRTQNSLRFCIAIFPALAERHGVLLYPFFLDGVALDPALNQPDGLHPNAQGVKAIVNHVGPYVLRLLGAATAGNG